MHHPTKIATCCYCGKRAALVLRGKVRHELACSGCGAPLHDMKMLKTPAPEKAVRKHQPLLKPPKLKIPKKKKKNRLRPAYLIGKVFDELEDVFDDIFD